MTTSTSHSESVAQYYDRKSLHEASNPKPTTSVESIHLKIVDAEEKGSNLLFCIINIYCLIVLGLCQSVQPFLQMI